MLKWTLRPNSLDRSDFNIRVVGFSFILEISVFIANSVDHDQMLHYVAADLGPHRLPRFSLWNTRHL